MIFKNWNVRSTYIVNITVNLFFMSATLLLVYLFRALIQEISQISLIIIGWFRSENLSPE